MALPRNADLKNRSQELRKNSTKEENHLWYDFLKNYPIQFNRQKIIGSYIVDFYCAKAKLALELDGSQHYQEDILRYDKERTKYLNSLSITVIRFTNDDVKQNFRVVCETIDKIVKNLCGQ